MVAAALPVRGNPAGLELLVRGLLAEPGNLVEVILVEAAAARLLLVLPGLLAVVVEPVYRRQLLVHL